MTTTSITVSSIKEQEVFNSFKQPSIPPGFAGSPRNPGEMEDSSCIMGIPVTPHASSPLTGEYHHLLHGIDSLDLGLYVAWGSDWKRRLSNLDKKKQQARKQGGLLVHLFSGRSCVFKPGGKGESYRFHLQFDAYNLFIGKAGRPGSSPNVYLSLAAKTLWLTGIEIALTWIKDDLKAIGNGSIQRIQISRLDLCADFFVSGGISHEFLLSHKVTRNDKGKLFLDKNELQTYYAADAKSPIQLRIYNKGLEVKQGGIKLWFLELWKRESTDDIWRIEYQIRRPALKQFAIDTLDDLHDKQAGLWHYLTSKWFTLRLPDNDKAERKTVHPFWSVVQDCFNPSDTETPSQIARNYVAAGAASPEWHLSHIDGCLSSFAALLGITNRENALQELHNRLDRRNNAADFSTACIKKAIQRGTMGEGKGV